MDLADQLAAVWARRVLVLGLALVLGAAVFLWRASSPEVYEASATLQVQPPGDSTDPAVEATYYGDTVVGLLKSRGLASQALEDLGENEDALDLAQDVTAEAGTEPGFVEVSVRDTDPAKAEELLGGLVDAVTERVQEDQFQQGDALAQAIGIVASEVDDLPQSNAQGRAALGRVQEALVGLQGETPTAGQWQVVTVADARADSTPVAPIPLRDALLAFLIGLIVVAELIVLRRAWRGALSVRDPAATVSQEIGVPAVAVGPVDPPGSLAPLLSGLKQASEITVVEHSRKPTGHPATLLAELLSARGNDVLLVDPGGSDAAISRELGKAATAELDEPRDSGEPWSSLRGRVRLWTPSAEAARAATGAGGAAVALHEHVDVRLDAVCAALRDDLGTLVMPETTSTVAVLVVDEQTTRYQVRRDVAALRGLGLEVVAAVVQSSSTRARRRRARKRRGLSILPASARKDGE